MVITKRTIALVICILLVAVIAVWLVPTEKRRIKRRFKDLSAHVGKKPGEGTLMTAAKAKLIAGLFADPCSLDVDAPGLHRSFARDELVTGAALWRSEFKTISLEFHDIAIEVTGTGTASATLTAVLKGRPTRGTSLREVRELEWQLVKVDGDWLFRECRVVEVLRN